MFRYWKYCLVEKLYCKRRVGTWQNGHSKTIGHPWTSFPFLFRLLSFVTAAILQLFLWAAVVTWDWDILAFIKCSVCSALAMTLNRKASLCWFLWVQTWALQVCFLGWCFKRFCKRRVPRDTHVISLTSCAANGQLMLYYYRLLKHAFKWYSNPNLNAVICVHSLNAWWEKKWTDVFKS